MNDTQSTKQTTTRPPTRAPMRRPVQDRMVAGVAVALGEYLGIPVGVVRVGFVILTIFGGAGLLLYGVGWLLIPEEGSETPIAGDLFNGGQDLTTWLGVGLLIAAALVALSWTNVIRGDFLFAAALLGVGILLLRGDIGSSRRGSDSAEQSSIEPQVDTDSDGTAAPGSPTDGEASTVGESSEETLPIEETLPMEETYPLQTSAALAVTTPPGHSEPSPPPPRPTPNPRRRRSLLGRLTFGATLVTLGVMAALDVAGLTRPDFHHYVAAVVIVAGGGLLVGTLWGRSYGLIAVGLLALPLLAFSTLVRVPLQGELGDVTIRPLTTEEVSSPYDMAIGDMTLDLRFLERGDSMEIEADLGIGQITVLVPADRPAIVDASVGIGQIDLLGDDRGGLGLDERVTILGDGSSDPLYLNVEAGIGKLQLIAYES